MLQFLCILVSSTIYTPPHALPYVSNQGLQYLTHSLERRLVLSLLCSWLNTSLSTNSSNWGEQLPYNHLLSKSGEDRRTLVKMSLMSLLVALDHWEMEQPRSPIDPSAGPESSASSFPIANSAEPEIKRSENAFRYFVSKLVSHNAAKLILNRPSMLRCPLAASYRRLYFHSEWHTRDNGRTYVCKEQCSSGKQTSGVVHH